MIEIGSRAHSQPPPPHIVFESLRNPDHDRGRPWLTLLDDEQRPQVVAADPPASVTWSSLWPRRDDARIRFDLTSAAGGTMLRWTLLVDEPAPDESLTRHLRKRLNQLINADLRFSYGN